MSQKFGPQLRRESRRPIDNSSVRHVFAALACCIATNAPHAEPFDFQRDCAQWIEQKGYSTEYIKLKVGKRQRGSAEAWRGNVEPKDVQPGDIVMSYIREKGRSMRVAYVEEVARDADGTARSVVISEWNVGKYADERCFVTDHFGRLSPPQRVAVEGIARVWRPSLPLPAAAIN